MDKRKINFSAFVVLNRKNSNRSINSNIKDQTDISYSDEHAKLLGENFIMIPDILEQSRNSKDQYLKYTLNLIRRNNEDIDIVGKINLQLKFNSYSELYKENNKDKLNMINNDDQHEIPEMDNKIPFLWRMRIFLRSATNLPFRKRSTNNVDNLPSTYVEMGWTQFSKGDLNFLEIIKSSYINGNRFPIWNQEFIYYPNQSKNLNNNYIDGFFNMIIKDIEDPEFALKHICLPINYFKSYHPVNADFQFTIQGQNETSHLYATLILEEV